MKPFDLEAAKAGAPVMTGSGNDVTIFTYDFRSAQPIVGYVHHRSLDSDTLCKWYRDGIYSTDKSPSCLDLVMAPVKVTMWANVYKNDAGWFYTGAGLYHTKEEARAATDLTLHCYVGAFPVEIEE